MRFFASAENATKPGFCLWLPEKGEDQAFAAWSSYSKQFFKASRQLSQAWSTMAFTSTLAGSRVPKA